jgi:hypothetical protein
MRAAFLALALAGAAAACDWREFDELKKHTPVAAISPPSNYPASNDFGPILLPIEPPADGSSAGRFVATATHSTSAAIATFDAAGSWNIVGISNPAFDLLGQGPITAIAARPGRPQVLLGAPYIDRGDILVLNVDPPYMTTTFATVPEAQYGVGVASGNISGAAAPEVVVLSTNRLHVFADVTGDTPTADVSFDSSTSCPLDFSASLSDSDKLNRAVVIGPLLAGGAIQIAVGTPVTAGAGHVSIFDFAGGAITCSATLTATESRFGVAMTLVDIDSTPGFDHLLVGAPPTHAYLYSLPLTTNAAPSATATDMMSGGSFGAAVAAFDLDGNPGDEVFIGDSKGMVGGTANAGRVSIYTGSALTLVPPASIPNPLAEHEPGDGHGYGSGVAGMKFCPGTADAGVASCTKLPIIGSQSKVYTYFTLRKPDPRVK